jgi:tetratricopeptide (TPR) repeat protein
MEYSEQIERYIEGRMGQEELDAFRMELSGNPQLAKLVADALLIEKTGARLAAGDPHGLTSEVRQEANKDIESFGKLSNDPVHAGDLKQFREVLKQAEKDQYRQDRSFNRIILSGRFWYYAAALVVLAVAIPLLVNRFGSTLSSSGIYTQFYLAYDGAGDLFDLTRSDNTFLQAVKIYEEGRYQEAISLLKPFISSEEYGSYALFYTGLAYMGLQKFTEAIPFLKQSLEKAGEEMNAPVHWYLGLSYLAVNDAGAAIGQFEQAGEHPDYAGKAARIIRKIRKVPGFSVK